MVWEFQVFEVVIFQDSTVLGEFRKNVLSFWVFLNGWKSRETLDVIVHVVLFTVVSSITHVDKPRVIK